MKLQSHTHQSLMATSISHPRSLKLAVTAVFILISFTFLPPKSVGSLLSTSSRGGKESNFSEEGTGSYAREKKMVLGSRPPGCENKCRSCRPCMAALVVPVHRMKRFKASSSSSSSSSREEDDSYYLLSWKCRCGNKIYQP